MVALRVLAIVLAKPPSRFTLRKTLSFHLSCRNKGRPLARPDIMAPVYFA
jgi:hypothetical protein